MSSLFIKEFIIFNLVVFICFLFCRVLYPEPTKTSKKDAKKDAKKDGKKDATKKETKKENKPSKVNEKKPTTVLTNGTPAKKAEKKPASPVHENGAAVNKKTEKAIKTEVKTNAQPKTQPPQTKTKQQAQPKAPPAPPVIEISIEAAKRIRNLKKKLKTIDELELKVAEGIKIDKDQHVKISKKSEVLAEIINLESGK